MAITQSALFVDPQVQWHRGNVSIDWDSAVAGYFKGALWNGTSVTPDFSQADPAYGVAPWNAGEVSGVGYTAGGIALTSVSYAELVSTPGKTGWDCANLLWTATTITADSLLVYIPSLTNLMILCRYFGQLYPTNDGDFEVIPHADGLFRRAHIGS